MPRLSRPVQRVSPYITDPASVGSQRAGGGMVLPFSIFDVPRLMAALRAGLIEGIPELDDPRDDALIACLHAHGQPLWAADQLRYHPAARMYAYMFWLDVKEAAKGNAEAKDRVDGAMQTWAQMRKDELISDIPNHTVGFWER